MTTSCLFCTYDPSRDPLDRELAQNSLYRAKPARFGAFGPGHILAMPTAHLRCFGAQPQEHDSVSEQFIADLEARVAAGFASPVIIAENGVYGQSVAHAHMHLFPARAAHYEIQSLIDAVPAGIRISEAMDLPAVRRVYEQEGEYVSVWENGARYLIHTQGVAPNIVRLRDLFLTATGLTHLRNWADLSEAEQQQNDAWVAQTGRTLLP